MTQAAQMVGTDTPHPVRTVQIPRRFVRDAWGGTETTVLETSKALLAAGHPTKVFSSLALSDSSRESIAGIEVRRFAYSYPFLGLGDSERADMDLKGGNLLSFALLRALLTEPQVDLLHAHSGKRLGGIVRTAARLRRIPYLITLHGGMFAVPGDERDDLLAPVRGKFEWGKAAGLLLGSRRVLEDAAAIICVGCDELDATRRLLPHQRVELIPNGVDSARFSKGNGPAFRQRFGIPPQAPLVLCVSRIDPQKNQLALVEGFPAVLRESPQARLMLIGPVTRPDYVARIRDRIEVLGLGDRVLIVPGLDPSSADLVNAFHAADVFCLPSMHEPFGIVVLEAWAAGCPVVASKVGGIPGFARHGEDALLVAADAPALTADAINRLLRDAGLAAALGEAGRSRATSEFDWTSIARRVADLYADVARRGAR